MAAWISKRKRQLVSNKIVCFPFGVGKVHQINIFLVTIDSITSVVLISRVGWCWATEERETWNSRVDGWYFLRISPCSLWKANLSIYQSRRRQKGPLLLCFYLPFLFNREEERFHRSPFAFSHEKQVPFNGIELFLLLDIVSSLQGYEEVVDRPWLACVFRLFPSMGFPLDC